MLGLTDLKSTIEITKTTVECPVRGCTERVARQIKSFKRDPLFQCPSHKIFISPTTFEYPCKLDNLLWKDEKDLTLLCRILEEKRECRMARDRSEDAVTWNVFRYLERTGQLSACLSSLCGCSPSPSELVYWSYSQREQGPWSGLVDARREFGEKPKQSSEPDLIVVTDKTLFWIEAKLTATDKVIPKKPAATKKYPTGGEKWFCKVFHPSYETVAIQAQKYELMRFWLLGSWSAERLGRDFCLINLVRSEKESDIECQFGSHIKAGESRKFLRLTWDDLYKYISDQNIDDPDNQQFQHYFINKTIGYDQKGQLKRAFCPDRGLPCAPPLCV